VKQILQDLKTGKVTLADIPTPQLKSGYLLIKSSCSLISLGTEKMLLEFGKANFLNKARQQPDKVKQVLAKIRTDGLKPTINAIQNKLDQPIPLGYSNVGTVISIGAEVQGYKIGDRVVSNGPHAEIVAVPTNLCSRIPDNVSNEEAAFTIVSAIALQSVRLTNPTIGETVVVIGLGLIGNLTAQVLQANGCNVIAYDFSAEKVELAKKFGIDAFQVSEFNQPIDYVEQRTNYVGADAVIITASTPSHEVISQAAHMCRKRGRITLLGVIGLNISRADFYEKELTFQVSCSYGPGRYDENYEKKGLDYPIGFVRWTEQRNFDAILMLMSKSLLKTKPLITKKVLINEAPVFYDQLANAAQELGILIDYPEDSEAHKTLVKFEDRPVSNNHIVVGFIGAGNFSTSTLLPIFKTEDVRLHTLVSASGLPAFHHGKKYGFEYASSDLSDVLSNPEINTVIISTPHNTHGKFVLEALAKNKNLFVEKPLCLTLNELSQIKDKLLQLETKPVLYVGFNRRFSPYTRKLKELLRNNPAPISMIMTVNAGFIPSSHWTQDLSVGGGRLVGEGCHFIDLLRYIAGSEIIDSKAFFANKKEKDIFTIQLVFKNGSIGSIHYFSNGHRSYPKEKLEVFIDGKIIVLENFKNLKAHGFTPSLPGPQDKGHKAEIHSFISDVRNGTQSIPLDEIFEVTEKSIILANS
jgi:predicted dehydrogenase